MAGIGLLAASKSADGLRLVVIVGVLVFVAEGGVAILTESPMEGTLPRLVRECCLGTWRVGPILDWRFIVVILASSTL